MHKLQGQSTTSWAKACSTLPEAVHLVNDLDGPRSEEDKETAEKVDGTE